MPDYQKMYAILCAAVDSVIDPLEHIPLAIPAAARLRKAMLDAEEVYINTSPCLTEAPGEQNIELRPEDRTED